MYNNKISLKITGADNRDLWAQNRFLVNNDLYTEFKFDT